MYNVHLEKVNDINRTAFINLYNLYLHDFADFATESFPNVDEDGYYDKEEVMDILDFSPEEGQSYIIRYADKIAGFVVLTFPPHVEEDCDYHILEMFVLNSHRGKGIGKAACKVLFDQAPGRYCLDILSSNANAFGFWDNLIATEGRLISRQEHHEEDEPPFVVYEFETRRMKS